eukprot:3023188-Karenia_brevis.AAC.1
MAIVIQDVQDVMTCDIIISGPAHGSASGLPALTYPMLPLSILPLCVSIMRVLVDAELSSVVMSHLYSI